MAAPKEGQDPQLEILLDYLKRSRGFDFTGYKRSSLQRRIAKRMQAAGVGSLGEYIDLLEVQPDEFAELFDTILINVTGFFRDPEAWQYLQESVIPRLVEDVPEAEPIRVWCAGCASGEEAYTVAMAFAEVIGEEAAARRLKIYATDADEQALAQARLATFTAKQVEAVPEPLRARYFDRSDTRYTFRTELRRTVIFGRNDLVQDAPISKIDLLVCRNTLMYFNAETQARILRRFHFAMRDSGRLFLGRSEMLITHTKLFTPVDLKRRVFAKVARAPMRDRLLTFTDADGGSDGLDAGMREMALDTVPVAQIVVDADGNLQLANARARAAFGLSTGDLLRPLQDLTISYRPLELRSLIDRAVADGRPVAADAVAWAVDGVDRVFDVLVTPLETDGNGAASGEPIGVSVTYVDVTAARQAQDELERNRRELETAYEELQSTVEELETTNEELQSTNEELETTNEELQSTNEELETMNEELQSTNEELETTNEELRRRSIQIDEVNMFLETILTSLGVAIAVVDPKHNVRIWNEFAEELWGVRADEAEGENLLSLDIGLPLDSLRSAIRDALDGHGDGHEDVLEAVDRRGRGIRCRVRVLPLVMPEQPPSGAMVLMESVEAG